MTEREKVISEGQEAIEMLERVEEPTPWCDFVRHAFENALALLKAQEPMKPIMRHVEFEYDTFSEWENKMYCPKCKMELLTRVNYCPKCGQAVKWE